MRALYLSVMFSLLLSGCVSLQTGLKLADFGVRAGFEVASYAKEKRKQAKEILEEEKESGEFELRSNH